MSSSAESPAASPRLLTTPLHDLHLRHGARMVPFAGYSMPVQYPGGVIAEHRHCRSAAALFDVSHMGQIRLAGADAAALLETLVPMDVVGLARGRQRYAFFSNEGGGLLDDLMVCHPNEAAREAGFGDVFLVVNAACKAGDLAHLQAHIGSGCDVVAMPDRALLALQGPQAVIALSRLNPHVAALVFMSGDVFEIAGSLCHVTRSGYTGEDGFEISVPAEGAVRLALALLDQPEVRWAGLGARDTLRLEAGLCLYGHDIDTTTSPVAAGLAWAMQKVRRAGGARPGGYPGADVIDTQFTHGAPTRRVGLVGIERVPVREGAALFDDSGQRVGTVTSGTLAPSVDRCIALAYVPAHLAAPGTELLAEVRSRRVAMRVQPLPFVPHRYVR
jgi:aminomethyltransferase